MCDWSFVSGFFFLLVTLVATAAEPETKKPVVGDHVPSYASTKCGGIQDGVPVGKTVCYTCRAGDEPIFYVFTREPNDSLVKLVKQIEAMVVARKDRKAAGVINFLGDPKDEKQRQRIADFGAKHSLQNLSLTITADGPKFVLSDDHEATVILFENGVIRLRTAVERGKFDDKAIEAIVRESTTILKLANRHSGIPPQFSRFVFLKYLLPKTVPVSSRRPTLTQTICDSRFQSRVRKFSLLLH